MSRDRSVSGMLRRLSGDASDPQLEQALKKLTESTREQHVRLESRLTELAGLIGQRATEKDANEILHAIRALGLQMRRAAKADRAAEGAAPARAHEARLYKQLDQLAQSSAPILVGPWTGEVGFELLYWIPFLAWARARWRIPDERFVIASRGGTHSWYGMPGARYVDIFSVATPEEFRGGTDPDAHKQRSVSAFDQTLVERVSAGPEIGAVEHLHPSVMYRNLAPFWQGEEGLGALERLTLFRTLEPPDDPVVFSLPPEYVAARFYFSDSFPDTPANRMCVRSIVEGTASRVPVVVLASGLKVDDHSDARVDAKHGITVVSPGESPERNLAVQSAVIARARGFVGTYGGLSYLAPFYRVPTVAFYSARAFQLHHLHVAQWALERLGAGTLTPVDVAQGQLLHAATAGLLPPVAGV